MTFADKNDYVFNDYLQLLIETGIPGLMLFTIIIFLLARSWRMRNETSVHLIASASGALFLVGAGLTSYPFQIISIWFNFVYFSLLISTLGAREKNLILSRSAKIFFQTTALVLCCSMLIYQWHSLNAKAEILNARSNVDDENYDEAIKSYQSALQHCPQEKALYLELGKCYLLSEQPRKSIETLQKALPFISDPFLSSNLGEAFQAVGNVKKSEEYYLSSVDMMPNRMYPRYLLFKMYLSSGQTLKAKTIGNSIMTMPVKINSSAIAEMKSEVAYLLKFKLPK